jgi:hypothetical protein
VGCRLTTRKEKLGWSRDLTVPQMALRAVATIV